MAGRTVPPAEELPGLSMPNLVALVDDWATETFTLHEWKAKDLLYELLRRIGELRADADEDDPTAPDRHDLIVELREAVGLFAGAMPIPPKVAWDEAVAVARRAVRERDEYEHNATRAAEALACDRRLASSSVYELGTALVLNLTVADVGAVLDTLLGRGWTKVAIAQAIGQTAGTGLQIGRQGRNAIAIRALLDQPVPERRDVTAT